MKYYEIRDPVFGFIRINEWERDIIDHWVFQRLRRIRQLAWTDMVYPGATHTRFEHSLGVMHIATQMFDSIVAKDQDFLKSELGFTEYGLQRDRVLVRLASLLHDVGHAPFSHAGEDLMPTKPSKSATTKQETYKHEEYSEAAIRYLMKDVIEEHPINENYRITADDVANFLTGKPSARRSLLWRSLLDGQLDADRADYLLRDSLHIGVRYGKFDLERLMVTLTVAFDEHEQPVLAIEDGGWHAAEGLIIARYMMFTQVYYQHTRRAYDYHISQAMQHILSEAPRPIQSPQGKFCAPTSEENIKNYLTWNDWFVYGCIEAGQGGEHANLIKERRHYRCIYETSETPSLEELATLDEITDLLGDTIGFIDQPPSATWYKFGKEDIHILPETNRDNSRRTKLLSSMSSLVKGLNPIEQKRIYVPWERKTQAESIVAKYVKKAKGDG